MPQERLFWEEFFIRRDDLKLVLIPGMDGTGMLFGQLIEHLHDIDAEVIPLPASQDQSYANLTKNILPKLPKSGYILLAESFSGPIAEQILSKEDHNVKAVIFAASFLSQPNTMLLNLAKHLPLHFCTKIPGSTYLIKKFLLDSSATKKQVQEFEKLIDTLPEQLLKYRLKEMGKLGKKRIKSLSRFNIPALYLQPDSDYLVNKNKPIEFKNAFQDLAIKRLSGTHFILQSNPKQSAAFIKEFYNRLTLTPHLIS